MIISMMDDQWTDIFQTENGSEHFQHSCVLLNDIVPIDLKTINSVENDYQLDG